MGFAKEIARVFVTQDLPVQVDVEVSEASDGGLHPHVHLLVATRTAGPHGLSRTKCRFLDGQFHRDDGRHLRKRLADAGNRYLFACYVDLQLVPLSNAQQCIHPACPRYEGRWDKHRFEPLREQWRRAREKHRRLSGMAQDCLRDMHDLVRRRKAERLEDARVSAPRLESETTSSMDVPSVTPKRRGSPFPAAARPSIDLAEIGFDPLPTFQRNTRETPKLPDDEFLVRLLAYASRDASFRKLITEIHDLSSSTPQRAFALSPHAAEVLERGLTMSDEGGTATPDGHTLARIQMIKHELVQELSARIVTKISRKSARPDPEARPTVRHRST